ncbi:GNAT family N-acetyltransferase [Saccharopolyspora sp. K220]|uniref:GNAT family N-acetyltransferase n=1 Tax=Saccharopolyspora soli TaxID=2926618 RepID=UPI001F561615|nr:GNAT family N-acetyltransferase [Saccharopolyspora soli]MCI2422086.1 GNAT family N-acetyltransferase [Saccharopolyspora soli]
MGTFLSSGAAVPRGIRLLGDNGAGSVRGVVEPEEVRTRRLVLRRIQPADTDVFVAVHTAAETHPFDAHVRGTREQILELLDKFQRSWISDGIGYWAIRLAGSEDVIGFGGVRHWVEEDEPVLNLAYRFWPSAWGNGYATEMAEAALQWARRNRPHHPVMIVTDADNAPSARVAEKLGFVLHTQRHRDGLPELVFRLPAPQPYPS